MSVCLHYGHQGNSINFILYVHLTVAFADTEDDINCAFLTFQLVLGDHDLSASIHLDHLHTGRTKEIDLGTDRDSQWQ